MKKRLTCLPPVGSAAAERSAPPGSRQGGFTLIELLIVMVLVAILLAVGGPSFQDSLQRNRQQSAFNSVVAAAALARSEAAVRVEPVSMCPSANAATCAGSAWEAGWLVFVDNGDGAGGVASDGILNGGEELLRIGAPAPNGVTIRSSGFVNAQSVVFSDEGSPDGRRGTFTVCDERGSAAARALVVQFSGQARIAVDADGSGAVEDHTDANDVTCP